jgi:enolase
MKIEKIHAREILDSRGNPTVSATVLLDCGVSGSASVPSGASTGSHEALELRDNDPKRYHGLGVKKAIRNIYEKIAPAIIGMRVDCQREIDFAMINLDGTPNKSQLGANAILGVSLACARAAANAKQMPLYKHLRSVFVGPNYDDANEKYTMPIPTMNILNGGAHAGWILDFQEFMIVPMQKKFRERIRSGAEIFYQLGKLLAARDLSTLKGDEGGYAVAFKTNEDALKIILLAIKSAGYVAGKEVCLAIDPAVSELYDSKTGKYHLRAEGKILGRKEMITLWERWTKKYPIISIEDGLNEDDWEGWKALTEKLGGKVALVGDDFLVTNTSRLARAINEKAGNAILIKVNQVGTLTEALDAIALAKQNGYKVSVSHRSGETEDTTIADLAVAVSADFIKTGSLSRSERIAKYNRLVEIEEEI